MPYLLDTNILIAAMKAHPAVCRRLEQTPVSDLLLSAIVPGELEAGAEKSQHCERNRARVVEWVRHFSLVGLNAAACRSYGVIRATLERQGTPIGGNDLWIAAQALAAGYVLVSDNTREFVRVPGLLLENWTVPPALQP